MYCSKQIAAGLVLIPLEKCHALLAVLELGYLIWYCPLPLCQPTIIWSPLIARTWTAVRVEAAVDVVLIRSDWVNKLTRCSIIVLLKEPNFIIRHFNSHWLVIFNEIILPVKVLLSISWSNLMCYWQWSAFVNSSHFIKVLFYIKICHKTFLRLTYPSLFFVFKLNNPLFNPLFHC